MKVTLESTPQVVTLDGVAARLWTGMTEGGVACEALIARVAVQHRLDQHEFEELLFQDLLPAAPAVSRPPGLTDDLEARWMAYAETHGRIPMDIRADGVIWYAVLGNLHLALRHPGQQGNRSAVVARAFMRQTIARLSEQDAEGGAVLTEMFGDVLDDA